MTFVEVENGRLFYEVNGKGSWLVLIHGAWAAHEWWRWQVSELSGDYRVLTLDVRGHGQSSPLQKAPSVGGFTKDLETLLQELGIDKVALVGWSMGGMIAIQYCLNHPSKVKAVILIATRGHRNPQMKRRILFQYLRARLSLLMDLAAPRKYDRVGEAFPGERERVEKEVRRMIPPSASREVYDWLMSDLVKSPRTNYFEVAKSFWNWEAEQELKRILLPTLILVGENDAWTPPSFSRLIHDQIPGSKLVIVEEAGHCLPLERPEVVNAAILKFLKGVGY